MVITLKQGANKKSIQSLIEKIGAQKKSKGIDAYAYCGKIKIRKDALVLQKELRDEWE